MLRISVSKCGGVLFVFLFMVGSGVWRGRERESEGKEGEKEER